MSEGPIVLHVKDFKVHIGTENGRVRLRFEQAITAVSMLPDEAIKIAEDIIQKARSIQNAGAERIVPPPRGRKLQGG